MEIRVSGTNIDEIMFNRRVFARNKRIWKAGRKKRRSAPRSEILIVKVDDYLN